MLDSIPGGDEMKSLLEESLYDVWTQLTPCIDEKYDMEQRRQGMEICVPISSGRQDAVRFLCTGKRCGIYGHPWKRGAVYV